MPRTTASNPTSNPLAYAERSVRAARPWVERLARLGYAARGAVYVLVGILAVQTAFGARRHATDTRGALHVVAQQSVALLAVLAVGLFGYALWRIVQGVLDAEHKGSDPKGLAKRAAMVGSGLIYGSLALAAARIALGAHESGGAGNHGAAQAWTAKLMSLPFGRWLVAAIGIGVMIGGLLQIRRGWTAKFHDTLKTQEMDAAERRLALRSGQLGFIARGVVFLLSGGFLVQAARRFDPGQVRGLAGALETLAQQPSGPWLLGATAVGLIAFGAYSLLLARYRRIVF
jgi:uncharacterized protein DUF1206